MRVAIDRSGRLVVPKALREELGVTGSAELEMEVVDGRLEATLPSRTRLIDRDGRPVFVADDAPPLTTEDVRELIERGRR